MVYQERKEVLKSHEQCGCWTQGWWLKGCLLTSRTLLRTNFKFKTCSYVPKMICSRELIKLCNICIDGSGHKPYNDADEQWSCVYSHKVIELEEAIQNLMITGIVEDWR